MASDILELAGTILECLGEAYASSHSPWDSVLLVLVSSRSSAILFYFCLFFLFLLYVNI
jgi:hypothetical protein